MPNTLWRYTTECLRSLTLSRMSTPTPGQTDLHTSTHTSTTVWAQVSHGPNMRVISRKREREQTAMEGTNQRCVGSSIDKAINTTEIRVVDGGVRKERRRGT